MLTAHSDCGFQTFILPEEDNTNHTVVLDSALFELAEDISIYFEVVDFGWRLKGVSDGCILEEGDTADSRTIKAGDILPLSAGVHHITVAVTEFVPHIDGMRKYWVQNVNLLSIGADSGCDIMIGGNASISNRHAIITTDQNRAVVRNRENNKLYVNGRIVRDEQPIEFGDCISIPGVRMIWLGDVIAIDLARGYLQCALPEFTQEGGDPPERAQQKQKLEKRYYSPSPRNLPKLYTEKIEIEPPPQPQQVARPPLLLTIGPSLTMALPMIIGTSIAIFGSRSSGGTPGVFMYTGIIIAVLSAVIGVIWSIVNLRYAKKQEKEYEELRIAKYSKYLETIEQDISQKYAYNIQSLNYLYPDAKVCAYYSADTAELWSRNASHDDYLYFRLGIGSIPFQCSISTPPKKFSLIDDDLAARPDLVYQKYRDLKEVSVGIDMRGKNLLGVIGQTGDATVTVLRNLVIQAAANICYTALKMVFLYDGSAASEQAAWAWARWLPHTWSADHKTRYFASDENERSEVCFYLANILRTRAEQESGKIRHRPYYIVFVSSPSLLEGMPAAKYLLNHEGDLGVTTVLFVERLEQLPNNCVNVIENDRYFSGTFNSELGDESRVPITFDSVSPDAADIFARTLSGIEVRDVESGGEIPSSLSFLDMYRVNAVEELNAADRWLKNRTYENLRVPIGQKAGGGLWNLDIHEKFHGPHGLIAGTTGSGKSETLQTYILSLAVNFSPEDVAFFLIDFKGGGMANLFSELPHTAGHISNLSGNQIHRAMVSIKSEIRRRQKAFGELGVNHIDQYTRLLKSGEAVVTVPHLFIVIDEFAELKRDEPDFMRELISVAQVGRSLGIHLLLATQKPGGTVDDNIWSNTRFRLCLRVQDRQDSNDVLHKPDAAYLTQAGRCYMQVGNDEIFELFQSAWSGAIYHKDPRAGKAEIANLWGNTGQFAAEGSHRKLKRLERERTTWLSALFSCARDAASSVHISLDDAAEEAAFLPALYRNLKQSGYDYSISPTNSQRVLAFLKVCAEMENDSESGMIARVADYFQKSGIPLPEPKEQTQLTAIVEYLAKIAKKTSAGKKRYLLWLPILPQELYLFDLRQGEMFDGERWPGSDLSLSAPVGVYDDPVNQTQAALWIDLTDNGSLAVCGSVASGKSTFLQTMLFSLVNRYSPDQLNIYILDYSNHVLAPFAPLCHVGDVVYESDPDKTEKLFVLLANIMKERKRIFQGGSYSQYIKSSGQTIPNVVVVIDNYANFREKTDNAYESRLIALSREGANYGIYLIISAGGFGTGELQNRIADNIRSVVSLEMGERFKYSEVMRTTHFDVLPEANVKGRGLASIQGRILEFQTALAIRATDDYERAEKLEVCFSEMNRVWPGRRAQKIPTIPVNPTWDDFVRFEDPSRTSFSVPGELPFGWNSKDATVSFIDLSKTYCWIISGKVRSGKTNVLKVLALSAAQTPSERYIIDFKGRLQKFAEMNGSAFIPDGKSLFEAMKKLIPEFRARNEKKRELLTAGLDDDGVYAEMCKFRPIFLFIDDLTQFINVTYNPPEGVGAMSGFLENITEKGFLHNIFVIAACDYSNAASALSRKVFSNMLSYKAGVHLGGNVVAQKFFDFSRLPYLDQTKATKAGIGLLPPNEYSASIHEVVIPLVKG